MNNQEVSQIMERLSSLWDMPIRQTTVIAKDWLDLNPTQNYQTLLAGIDGYRIIVKDEALFDLTELQPSQLNNWVQMMRGSKGFEIRDRTFHLKSYPTCFVGQEAVDWMVNTLKISTYEAIGLGRECVRRQIFHHVLHEHNFEDDFLFYRFTIDEAL